MEDQVIRFLKWVRLNCTTRTTSRDNVYTNYWQNKFTNLLYTDQELWDHWKKNFDN